MNLKKTLFTGMAAVTLFSASAALISSETGTQVVEARTVSRKLSHSAAIYNSRGRRAGKPTLKKGKSVRVRSYKTIKGRKFAYIGRGEYVLVHNLSSVKNVKKSKKRVVKKSRRRRVTKKRVAKKSRRSESTALKRKYEKWLKNYKRGNLVAIRNTTGKKDHMFYNVNSLKMLKGTTIPLHEDASITKRTVVKRNGQYYLRFRNHYGTEEIKAADFKFVPWNNRYNKIVKNIRRHTDNNDQIKITLNKATIGHYGPFFVKAKTHKVPARKKFVLQHPLLLRDGKGQYVITGSNYAYDGFCYQIPYNTISKFEPVGKYVF